jgi:hypothetical protein
VVVVAVAAKKEQKKVFARGRRNLREYGRKSNRAVSGQMRRIGLARKSLVAANA